ncbi:MAG: hypothetical protein P8P99_10690, partial [Maricaulis sp.]|nr:hypothetical protein [Maricaulis sp.]
IGQVSEVASQTAALFQALERPVMTNLDALFEADALTEIWPAPLPDLYFGELVTLTARLEADGGVMILEGELAGETWHQSVSLADAQPASGIATLWARNRIRGLEESRFTGAPQAAIDAAVLQTSLDFHLVSRLTSLVAVDATPARPVGERLASTNVPLMVPEGWDFEAVMEEAEPAENYDAALTGDVLARLRASQDPAAAPKNSDGIALPATATPRGLLMLIGLILMICALVWMVTHEERRLW